MQAVLPRLAGRQRFDPEIGSLRTWLFAILRNVVIDLGRARAARPVVAEGGTEPSVEPIEETLLAWQVEEAMRRIGDQHREILVETYYRGRPYAEVAAELGIPVGTVKSRVYYARGPCGSRSRRWAMMTERPWRESLGAYALGHLSDEERAGLEAHLEGCPSCRAELEQLIPVVRPMSLADPARFESAPPLPVSLGARVAGAITRERLGRRRRRRVSASP